MKALVTGVAGQLGHDVMNELAKRGIEGVGSDLAPEYAGMQDGTSVTTMPYLSMDITDPESVRRTIIESGADTVIHCAAWTAVDAAEDPEKKDLVHKINAEGTENIAEAAKAVDAKMVYLSTDYVFDGQGERLFEDVKVNPTSARTAINRALAEDGEYRFEMEATDKCGNHTTYTYSFIVDANAPLIELSGVKNYDSTDKAVDLIVKVTENFYTTNKLSISGTRTDINGVVEKLNLTGYNVNAAKAENGVMYNLAGQKVNNGYKGVVIMNGKKMLNK